MPCEVCVDEFHCVHSSLDIILGMQIPSWYAAGKINFESHYSPKVCFCIHARISDL